MYLISLLQLAYDSPLLVFMWNIANSQKLILISCSNLESTLFYVADYKTVAMLLVNTVEQPIGFLYLKKN